jgi:hypothetical protein
VDFSSTPVPLNASSNLVDLDDLPASLIYGIHDTAVSFERISYLLVETLNRASVTFQHTTINLGHQVFSEQDLEKSRLANL